MKRNWNFDERLKTNFFLADYFAKTQAILKNAHTEQTVTMQWFQRKENVVVCGIDYIVDLLKFVCPNWKKLTVFGLKDGDVVSAFEPVLKITGKYADFAYLEGLIDGVLARGSSIATNSSRVVLAANGKSVINMVDRADLFLNQGFDGYASYIGGMRIFCTPSAIEFINDESVPKPTGTIPHSLIASFDGDLIKATEEFRRMYPQNDLCALIDYNNDCVNDAIKVIKHFKNDLKMVRIDTSFALIDKSLNGLGDERKYHGVNPTLIKKIRQALNDNGGSHVKIIVSSGFDQEKISWFEQENAPVDFYGVGEAIVKEKTNFTGDIVLINDKPQAKFGRKNTESNRLKNIL